MATPSPDRKLRSKGKESSKVASSPKSPGKRGAEELIDHSPSKTKSQKDSSPNRDKKRKQNPIPKLPTNKKTPKSPKKNTKDKPSQSSTKSNNNNNNVIKNVKTEKELKTELSVSEDNVFKHLPKPSFPFFNLKPEDNTKSIFNKQRSWISGSQHIAGAYYIFYSQRYDILKSACEPETADFVEKFLAPFAFDPTYDARMLQSTKPKVRNTNPSQVKAPAVKKKLAENEKEHHQQLLKRLHESWKSSTEPS